MKKILFVVIFVLFAFALTAEAAPAPWGLALNQETKECAGYWAGDEFIDYGLPEGWKSYYPTYDSNSAGSLWKKIETESGECSFQMRKEEACCMELGYTYVSDNIGKGQMTKLRDPESLRKPSTKFPVIFFAVTAFMFAIAIAIFIFLFYILWKKFKSKKTSDKQMK